MCKQILVPTDGSTLSDHAVEHAIGFAKQLGAKITALHVVGAYHPSLKYDAYIVPHAPAMNVHFEEADGARAKRILEAVRKSARAEGVECETAMVRGDSPSEMIIKQADCSNCDLIVMASHGRRGLKGLLLGGETVKVLAHSKIPVLVIH
jgi:nucleotide-binding universal stress UspA family protein